MRVRMTNDSKQLFTVAEMPYVNQIISDMKEDNGLKDYCMMAANLIGNERWEIYRPDAEMCKNCRVDNYYSDNSGNADVWISFLAFNAYAGAYEIGICLTDIWNINGENKEEILPHMYINAFDGQKVCTAEFKKSDSESYAGVCGHCGKIYGLAYERLLMSSNFCPNCGVKMNVRRGDNVSRRGENEN